MTIAQSYNDKCYTTMKELEKEAARHILGGNVKHGLVSGRGFAAATTVMTAKPVVAMWDSTKQGAFPESPKKRQGIAGTITWLRPIGKVLRANVHHASNMRQ